MRAAAICLCAALLWAPQAWAQEDDEEPVAKASSLSGGLLCLGRGREARGWKILRGHEAEALPMALEGLRDESPALVRGAARFLADAEVWGKSDHPEWRAPVEQALEAARTAQAAATQSLQDEKLPPARRSELEDRRRAAAEREELCLEARGLLGNVDVWRELAGSVDPKQPAHVIRGAARGLLGPRGGLRRLLRALNRREFLSPDQIGPGWSRLEADLEPLLADAARGPQAESLIEETAAYPSVPALSALQSLSTPPLRRSAWRALERAAAATSSRLRAAGAALGPKVEHPGRAALLGRLLDVDPAAEVRIAAASALGKLPRSEGQTQLAVLVEALRGGRDLRLEAGRALVKLTGVKLAPRHAPWERWLSQR